MKSEHSWKQRVINGRARLAIGMVIALSMSLMAFEWTTYDHPRVKVIGDPLPDEGIEMVHPPVTHTKQGKKAVQQRKKKKAVDLNNVVPMDEGDLVDEGPDKPSDEITAGTVTDAGSLTPADELLGDEPGPVGPVMPFAVEIMPHFKNCFSANALDRDRCTEERIHQHLERHLTIPNDVRKNIRTTVTFVITTDGTVGKIHYAPRVPKSVEQEIERVLKNMPEIEPGIQQGHKVPVYYQIPISVKFIG